MPDVEGRFGNMLFAYATTNLTDYRKPNIGPSISTKFIEKPRSIGIRPWPLKDVHTLSDWKTGRVIPFDLLHKPRPIVCTNPWTVQKKYEKPIDAERELAAKTRPRLVMTPAVSMDDIEDPRTRSILCEDMYTSAATRAQREAVAARANVRAPLPPRAGPSNRITLPKLQPPYVSPEWRMETVQWDKRQLRAHCDPTERFWLAYKSSGCKACEESATVTAHRKGKGMRH